LRLAVVALRALVHNRLPYGVVLPEGCAHGGHGECSICRDDMIKPVRLSCGHVFCDGCIVDWLEVRVLEVCSRGVVRSQVFVSRLFVVAPGDWLLRSSGLR
jgi:hypothetical protein